MTRQTIRLADVVVEILEVEKQPLTTPEILDAVRALGIREIRENVYRPLGRLHEKGIVQRTYEDGTPSVVLWWLTP